MKNSSAFLLFITLLFSCEKHELNDDGLMFEGKWKWTESSIVYNTGTQNSYYEIVSSDSLGIPDDYFLEFDRKGKVKYYKNGKIEKNYRIVFHRFEENPICTLTNCYSFVIYLNNDDNNILSGGISQDTLWVDDSNIPLIDVEPTGPTIFYNHLYLKVN